jgi:hypothetical protein
MSTVITRENIVNGDPFILKWANDPNKQNGVYNPGWKQQTEADNFLVHVDNQTSIINECRFIVMDAKEYDISYLRVKARLQYMGRLTASTGKPKDAQLTDDYTTALNEVVPEFSRNSLIAVPFSAFTWTAKTFLLENIEKASFLPRMEAILAERAGVSAEAIGMYGIKKASGATQDGMDHLDGIFQQLTAVKTAYDAAAQTDPTSVKQEPMGYFTDIDSTKPFIPQLKKMLTQYSIQKGNRSNAKFYVSNLVYGLLVEEADARETGEGDRLYFHGGELSIWNTPVVVADFLDTPENDWGEQILLADPESIVFGFLDEITSENSYEHDHKAYLSSVDVYFDTLILWNKDVLAAKVVTPSGGGE